MQGPLASPIRARTVVARCTCKLTVLERGVLDGMRQEFPLRPRPPGAVTRPQRSLAFSYAIPFCNGASVWARRALRS